MLQPGKKGKKESKSGLVGDKKRNIHEALWPMSYVMERMIENNVSFQIQFCELYMFNLMRIFFVNGICLLFFIHRNQWQYPQ